MVAKNVPELRFPEFEDEWDEKSFGTLFKTSPSKKYQINANEIEDNGLVPVVTQGKEKISGFSNETTKTCKLAPIIAFGDHTTNLKLIKEDFILGGDGIKLLNPKEGDIDYLFHALEYYNIKPEGYKRHFSILKEISLPIPSITEQKKIGKFLTSLDDKIDLLTRSCEQWGLYKQEVMRRLFNRELRFPEFHDEWKTVKLGEIAEITMGQSPSSNEYTEDSNDTILIQGNADLDNGKVKPRIFTKKITKTSKKGDLILTVRAPVGDLAINEFNACIGRGVCSIRTNNTKFTYYFLEDSKRKHIWDKLSQGTTFEAINSNDIKNLKIQIPSLKEQEKIVNLLTSLDKKIELQEQQLEQTKQFKKAMLQKMFI